VLSSVARFNRESSEASPRRPGDLWRIRVYLHTESFDNTGMTFKKEINLLESVSPFVTLGIDIIINIDNPKTYE
jgi:hypothetical protein